MFFLVVATVVFVLVVVGSAGLDETGATIGVFFLPTSLEEDFAVFDESASGAWVGLPLIVGIGRPLMLKTDGFNESDLGHPSPTCDDGRGKLAEL